MEPEGSSPYSQAPATCPYPVFIFYNSIKNYAISSHFYNKTIVEFFLWF